MLEQLFGSRTRVLLLRLFLDYPGKAFFVRELARTLGTQLHSIRRELDNLESFGLLTVVPGPEKDDTVPPSAGSSSDAQKKYYAMNPDFILYPELRALFLKARLLIEKDLVHRLQEIGQIQLLVLTGMFVGLTEWPTDIFIVGNVNRKKIRSLIRRFEKELHQNINYTIMTKHEFKYRREITDRFIFNVLENKRMTIIDKIFAHTNE